MRALVLALALGAAGAGAAPAMEHLGLCVYPPLEEGECFVMESKGDHPHEHCWVASGVAECEFIYPNEVRIKFVNGETAIQTFKNPIEELKVVPARAGAD